jgi:hypothetical protein
MAKRDFFQESRIALQIHQLNSLHEWHKGGRTYEQLSSAEKKKIRAAHLGS